MSPSRFSTTVLGVVGKVAVGIAGTDAVGALGIKVLQMTLENGGKDDFESRKLLKLFVKLLDGISGPDAMKLVRTGVDKFVDAAQPGSKGSKKNAESLSRAAVYLLITAIEMDDPNEKIARGCLAKCWAQALDEAAQINPTLAKEIVTARVDEFHKFSSDKDIEQGKMARKAFMVLLQVANEERRDKISRLLSECVVDSLSKAIGGHRDIVDKVLAEEAAGILAAINDNDTPKAIRISGTGHSMLIAAGDMGKQAVINDNGTPKAIGISGAGHSMLIDASKEVVKMLAKVWLENLSQALKSHPKIVQALIDDRAKTLYTFIAGGHKAWDAEFEVLLTAIRMGEAELARRLAASFTEQLAKLMDGGQKGLRQDISKMVHGTIRMLRQTTDHEEADTISSAGVELFRAATQQNKSLLAKDLSHAWISVLESGMKGDPEMLPKLIKSRTAAFLKAVEDGNEEEAETLTTVGVELLMQAIYDGANETKRVLSISWAKVLADAIDNHHEVIVGRLIEIQTKTFNDATIKGDRDKAGKLSLAGMELLMSAIGENRKKLVKFLSKSWAEALSNAIDGDGRVDAIVIQSECMDQAVDKGDLDEAEMLSMVAIVLTAEVGEDKQELVEILSETRVASLAYVIRKDPELAERLMGRITRRFDGTMADDKDVLSVAARNILQTARSSVEFSDVVKDIERYWTHLE